MKKYKRFQEILKVFIIFLTILSLISGCGPLTPAPTLTPPVTPPINSAPTPNLQPVAEQDAWLDESINTTQFSPTENLIFHFKNPMSPSSSTTPILSWPSVEGISSWNESKTTLTFNPTSVLDSKKTYTFFLDPALQFVDGTSIKKSDEWTIYINSGPKILNVSPEAGSLSRLFETIEIKFDRDMLPSNMEGIFSLSPQVPYEISWKSSRILQINLQQPFSTDQKYDLTLRTNESLLAEDGSYLAEDYRWFYWQSPLHTNVKTTRKNAVELDFNYTFDKEKSGIPFQISPELKGEWRWMSPQKVIFIADDIIPASQEYEVTVNSPLVDKSGFRISQIPSTRFSGLPPIHLKNQGIEKSSYSDTLLAKADLDAVRLEFDIQVNHLSAEKAFSLTPAISGIFHWEKNADGSKEVLVYTLDNLLDASAIYNIKINTNLLDNTGRQVIVQPYQQQFQRGWSYLTPSFGEGGDNIQVIDANGPRRLQISGNDPDISFTAYSFDLSEYAALYAKSYQRRQGNVLDIPIPSNLSATLTWAKASTRIVGNDDTIIETIVPPDLLPGLYVVNLEVKNRLYDQLFLVISQNTLLVKSDGDDLYVWLTNINGEVVADAEIRVYSSTGEKIRQGRTDENGQYKVNIPQDANVSLVSAFVKEPGKPNDTIIVGFNGTWQSWYPYDYRDTSYNLPAGKPYLTYIYTERPLYRPGQTVNFKTIVRKDDDLKYTLPNVGAAVQVLIKDGRENTLDTFDFTTNAFGTINGSFDIPEEAVLGLYTIEAQVDGISTQEFFKVEDYRKPDYQVDLTSLQPDKENKFVLGEEVKMQVNAAYFFGEPVANAVMNVDFFMPWPMEINVTRPVKTDENGNATLSFKAPYDDSRYSYYSDWGSSLTPQTVRMEVTINDGSNQTVTGVYNFLVYPSSEQPRLQTDGYFFQPNKPFLVTIQDVDLFDEPIVGREISLTTHSWNRDNYEFNTASQSFKLQTDSQGMATQEIALGSGYHKLSLQTKDAAGHTIEVSKWVYIFKDKNDWVYWNREQQVQISAEKDSYKPYEKASLMIESTFSGPALLTFERGSVINSKLIQLTAPLTIFETDIIPEHAPNVYITVSAWQASTEDVYRYGYRDAWTTDSDSYLRTAKTQILVDAGSKELEINIVTDKQTYEPGEKVIATIDIKDKDGNPVLAELSLAVVDEAIFALADEFSPDIFDAFYGQRQHTVDTFDSMSPYRVIMYGGQGGGGDEIPPQARSEFVDTSAWLPVIQTDKDGQAVVSFNLPDNTTSWRLTVKAITLNHLVGQASANIESTKDVFIRPVLPRVLTRGDQASLTAFIHNYSDQEKNLTVSFAADGLDVQGNNTSQTITLKAGEVLPIGWRVLVNRATPTDVNITVQENDRFLDAVKLPLLLQPAAVRDIQNQSGEFNGTLVLDVALPNVDLETSQVILTLNQSMSGTLLNGIEYLTGYPYGCVEQTMSRALPNAVVGRAADQLGIGGPALENQLDPLIQASINKLYSLQHGDGGWGWWNDDISDEYQTAWVLFGLGVLDESGYTIEPKVLDNAVSWLNGQVTRYYSGFDIRTRAYSLYSMAQAGRGNLEATQKLASESIYELDPFSQAALALALHKMGEKEQARQILDLLSQSAEKMEGSVYWPQPNYDGEYHSKTMASTTRTTAIILLAYAKIDPQSELIPGIVQYLSSQRKGIYGWGTTNETSFVILALTEYLISQEKELGSVPYQVSLNGKEIYTGTLEVGNASVNLDIPVSALNGGGNSILVSTQGDRPLYFDLSTKYDLLQKDISAAGSVKVTRKYLDPKTNKPLEVIQAGELVKVELTINIPENAYFIAVEDYLPGGLEALNEGLNATSQSGYDSYYYPSYWQDYGYNYKEIRGDRVVFFITAYEKGTRVFTYYARATTSGEFTALSTQVYAMYDASMWGRSESTEIRIK